MDKAKWPATHGELVAAGYEFKNNATCKGPTCSTQIYWYRTPAGKAMPLSYFGDRDGQATFQAHWADCPDAKKF